MRKLQRSAGSGSGTVIGYRVEARIKDLPTMAMSPIELGNRQILTHEFQEITFEESARYGVPLVGDYMFPVGASQRLMPYDSALALSWTIIAQNQHKPIECRIVQYRMKYNYTMEYNGYAKDSSNLTSSWYDKLEIVDDVPNANAPSGPMEAVHTPGSFVIDEPRDKD